jgi:hypothetical protein
VPLVCNRWHRVMADASMWSVVDVEPRGDRDTLNAGSMVKWLQQRGSGMRKLKLRASNHCCTCPDPYAECSMYIVFTGFLALHADV